MRGSIVKKQKIENFQDVTAKETLTLRDYPHSVSDFPNAVIARFSSQHHQMKQSPSFPNAVITRFSSQQGQAKLSSLLTNAVIARFPSAQYQAKQSSSSTQYPIPQTSNPVFSEDVTSDQTSHATAEIKFSLFTPVVYFYTWDHLGTVRLITNSSCTVVSKHDYEPFGVEIPPYNDTASNTHKFTGQERDASTGYDYMHFRFYASSIGCFLKPDNIIPDITNPQNWNAYTYVKGNPVNYNDPSGHTENQPLQQENKQNQPVGPTQPSTQNIEAMKNQEQKMVDQPKKVDVNKAIAQLIATGQIGSFKVSSDVQNALQNNPAFKKGFEAWLTTPTGQQQFQQMSSDKNTSYVVEIGQPTPKGPEPSLGETLASYFNTNPSPNMDCKVVRVILEKSLSTMNNNMVYDLAFTLGHEGFLAESFGSGKYTDIGADKINYKLTQGVGVYWKEKKYIEELNQLGYK